MNTKQCELDIYYLYGLYVNVTYVHICIHGEIKVNYLPNCYSAIPHLPKTSEEFLRQTNKTYKSQSFMSFASQYMSRDISRASNEL